MHNNYKHAVFKIIQDYIKSVKSGASLSFEHKFFRT